VGADQVHPYSFDVADAAVAQQMIGEFATKAGRLDVVIANAGITDFCSFLDYTPEAFDRLIGVNLRGIYFTAQAAAKIMIKKEIPGRIILMSSATGQRAFLNLSVYGITKAGIQHMARSLALELGRYGITVNAISPGATLTERNLKDDPAYERNWASVNPTGRVGYVEDIVAAGLFLASPGARQITGQTVTVDGGWSLIGPLPEEHPKLPEKSK
jgi:3-oxoacyl-[acyl-carrier protein] reductase